MALNLDKDYSGTTLLSSWWTKVKSNFSAVETAVNANTNSIGTLQAMNETLQDSIDIEEANREGADTKLQTQINDEATARQMDVAELKSKINNEVSARKDADNDLKYEIDNALNVLNNYKISYVGKVIRVHNKPDSMYIGKYLFMSPTEGYTSIELMDSEGENAESTISYPDGFKYGYTYILDFVSGKVLAEIVPPNVGKDLYTETEERRKADNALQAQINVLEGKVSREIPNTWEDVQNIIRNGLADKYFSIGDQFIVEKYKAASVTGLTGSGITSALLANLFDNDFPNLIGEIKAGEYVFAYSGTTWHVEDVGISEISKYLVIKGTPKAGDTVTVTVETDVLTFDVIGFDHDTPTDTAYTHSMTLQLHNGLSPLMQFDAPEATWYFEDGLATGDYHFVHTTGTAYNFTIKKAVPSGGQIRFDGNNTIYTYESAESDKALETIAVSGGSDGDSLTAYGEKSVNGNANASNRFIYGSNNWSTSAIRQWLNTDVLESDWWEPRTVFDRKPSYADNQSGFLRGLDPSFVRVVGRVNKKTQKSTTDGYGLDTTTERFFLLSRAEVYGGTERSTDGADGMPYAYYKDNSGLSAAGLNADTNRIKYTSDGAVKSWWLRTPNCANGRNAGLVTANGSIDRNIVVNGSYLIVPACVIY